MRRYLLDTNSASHCIFRRKNMHERVAHARAMGAKIGIGMPVLAELLAGIENSASREKNLAIVDRNLHLFRLWPFTAEDARVYARLFAALRKAGRTIGAMDLQIAAIALNLGHSTVVTSDSDFTAVPGLSVENWAS
jgi:tRNA(fMet)-specific endonuclease VapC